METQNIIIGLVIVLGILLIGYILNQNNKDKKNMTQFLDETDKSLDEKDPEYDDDTKSEH